MAKNVGQVSLHFFIKAFIGQVEGRNSEIRFECLVLRVIKSMVRSIVPKPAIFISIMFVPR